MLHYYKWGRNEEISKEEAIRICENNRRIVEKSKKTGNCKILSDIILVFTEEKGE